MVSDKTTSEFRPNSFNKGNIKNIEVIIIINAYAAVGAI